MPVEAWPQVIGDSTIKVSMPEPGCEMRTFLRFLDKESYLFGHP